MTAVQFIQVTPEQMSAIVAGAVAEGVRQAFRSMKSAPETMNEAEAAEFLRMSANTLRNYRVEKRGPKYCKNGSRVIYRRSDLESWLESQSVHTIDSRQGSRHAN